MSVFTDLHNLIRFRIKDEGTDTEYLDATLWTLGQEAIRTIHRILVEVGSDHVISRSSFTATNTASGQDISGSLTNLMAPVERGMNYDTATDSYTLTPMTFDRLNQYSTGDTASGPEEYLFIGSTVYLRPIPTASPSINIDFFQTVDQFMPASSSASLPWSDLFNDAIVYWVAEAVMDHKRIFDTTEEKGLFSTVTKMVLRSMHGKGGEYLRETK